MSKRRCTVSQYRGYTVMLDARVQRRISRANPRVKRSQRYSVDLMKHHPWPRKTPRQPPPPLPMFFANQQDAIDEAALLAADQYADVMVGDELEGELVALIDAKNKRITIA